MLQERESTICRLQNLISDLKQVAILRATEKSEVVIQLAAATEAAAKLQSELVIERSASEAKGQSEARLSSEMQSLRIRLQDLETRGRKARPCVLLDESSSESSQQSSSYNLRGRASSPPRANSPSRAVGKRIDRSPILDGSIHASGGRMSGQRKGPGSKEFLLNVGYGRLEASTIKSLDDLNWVDGEEDEVLVSFAHGRASFRLYPAVLSSTNDAMVFCFEDGRQRQSSTVYSPAILLSLTHLLNVCWCLNGHRLRPHTCFYCLTRASFRTPQTQSLEWTSWFQH